jgi:hypothetical protein
LVESASESSKALLRYWITLGVSKIGFINNTGKKLAGVSFFFFLVRIFPRARLALVLGTQPTANQARNRCDSCLHWYVRKG